MPRLAAYRTAGKPGEFHGTVGTTTVGDCSAHWFTVKGNIVALGNYEQGTRFVDISDPTNPQQVGWFRVPAKAADAAAGTPEILSSNTAGAYWHGKYVYIADYARGIDIIKIDDSRDARQDPAEGVLELLRGRRAGRGRDLGRDPGRRWRHRPGHAVAVAGHARPSFGGFTPGVAKDYAAAGHRERDLDRG